MVRSMEQGWLLESFTLAASITISVVTVFRAKNLFKKALSVDSSSDAQQSQQSSSAPESSSASGSASDSVTKAPKEKFTAGGILHFRKLRRKYRNKTTGLEEEKTEFEKVAVRQRPARSKIKVKSALKWKDDVVPKKRSSEDSKEKKKRRKKKKRKGKKKKKFTDSKTPSTSQETTPRSKSTVQSEAEEVTEKVAKVVEKEETGGSSSSSAADSDTEAETHTEEQSELTKESTMDVSEAESVADTEVTENDSRTDITIRIRKETPPAVPPSNKTQVQVVSTTPSGRGVKSKEMLLAVASSKEEVQGSPMTSSGKDVKNKGVASATLSTATIQARTSPAAHAIDTTKMKETPAVLPRATSQMQAGLAAHFGTDTKNKEELPTSEDQTNPAAPSGEDMMKKEAFSAVLSSATSQVQAGLAALIRMDAKNKEDLSDEESNPEASSGVDTTEKETSAVESSAKSQVQTGLAAFFGVDKKKKKASPPSPPSGREQVQATRPIPSGLNRKYAVTSPDTSSSPSKVSSSPASPAVISAKIKEELVVASPSDSASLVERSSPITSKSPSSSDGAVEFSFVQLTPGNKGSAEYIVPPTTSAEKKPLAAATSSDDTGSSSASGGSSDAAAGFMLDDDEPIILSGSACQVLEIIMKKNLFRNAAKTEGENELIRLYFAGKLPSAREREAQKTLERAIDLAVTRVKCGGLPSALYEFLNSNRATAINLMIDAMKYRKKDFLPRFWDYDRMPK